jgi:carboxyl-terminal processing protease
MVDRFSASASEIFAGAIQDYGRGVIVGNPTFGKGTVQTLVDLDRFVPRSDRQLGQLKLTIAKFYRVNGSSTQHRGVLPDIRFPAVFGVDEIGESAQENALPWDEITPVRHRGSRFVSQVIPDLRRRHQARLRTEPGLKLLLEDIQEAKRARDRTRVSLLESKRRAERSQLDERRRARENQLRRAQGLKPLKPGQKITDDSGEKDPDPLLDESVRVMSDLINLLDRHGAGSKALVMSE